MATYKIMLVEDDNNLRAIYGDRLMAEGYEIVSARDGEEALAMAVKEKPNLIISDVMMPKISGFDMLDILRTTPETKDVKVIMMTALSQAEDKERADKLGADKYLVKSQVTLEDVARVVHEVLGDSTPDNEATAYTESGDPVTQTATAEQVAPVVAAAPAAEQVAPSAPVAPEPVATNPFEAQVPAATMEPQLAQPEPASPPSAPDPMQTTQNITTTDGQDASMASSPASQAPAPSPVADQGYSGAVVADPVSPQQPIASEPATSTPPSSPMLPSEMVEEASSTQPITDSSDAVNSAVPSSNDLTNSADDSSRRVIQPLPDSPLNSDAAPKIYELYEKEMAAEASATSGTPQHQVQAEPAIGVIQPTMPVVSPESPESTPPNINQPTQQPQQPAPAQPQQPFDPNSVAL